MIEHIYLAPFLDRQLEKLRKSDKKGKRAAKQVDLIVDILCSSANPHLKLKSRQTRHGELRLANCRKYDLGSGYRLITVWDKGCVILVFAGNHDECHLWLEKQRDSGLDIPFLKSSCSPITVTPRQLDEVQPQQEDPFETDEDPYEEELLGKVDQKTLRKLFRGFYRSD